MNALLQAHGCATVFSTPEGLKELMSDITREVLRDQPENILEYITNYLSAMLVTREHGLLAASLLSELCDCRPPLEDLLVKMGIQEDKADECARIIQHSFEEFKGSGGEKLQERVVLKKVLCVVELSGDQAGALCRLMRDLFRQYWLKKQTLLNAIELTGTEPWEEAARRTIELYESTRPYADELARAAEKIQAAYRGYHTRKQLMARLRARGPGLDQEPSFDQESGRTNLDVAASRDVDLGPKVSIKVPVEWESLIAPVDVDVPKKPIEAGDKSLIIGEGDSECKCRRRMDCRCGGDNEDDGGDNNDDNNNDADDNNDDNNAGGGGCGSG